MPEGLKNLLIGLSPIVVIYGAIILLPKSVAIWIPIGLMALVVLWLFVDEGGRVILFLIAAMAVGSSVLSMCSGPSYEGGIERYNRR